MGNNNNNNNNNNKVRRLFSNNAIDTREDSHIIPRSITTRKTITVDTSSTRSTRKGIVSKGSGVDRDAPPTSSSPYSIHNNNSMRSMRSIHNNNSMRSMRSIGSKQKGKKTKSATSPNSISNSNSMRSMRTIGSQLVQKTKKRYNKGLSF